LKNKFIDFSSSYCEKMFQVNIYMFAILALCGAMLFFKMLVEFSLNSYLSKKNNSVPANNQVMDSEPVVYY